MSGTLVVVSVGPVQEFIASARRTRDFWMGSTLLGEFSRAIAKTIADRLGLATLIFPAPENEGQLLPIRFDEKNTQLQSEDVSNVILFEAPPSADISSLVRDLKQTANDRWKIIAEGAAKRCESELHDWRRQLEPSPVEFYAAWAPLANGYETARKEAMRLLAGRKALRDFDSWKGTGAPKSSLDGGRETVLKKIDDERPLRRRRGLHARPNEQLDLIGIVKRVDWGHDAIRYPSVSRIAIDPWVRGVKAAGGTNPEIARLFEDILTQCKHLGLRERREKNPWNIEDDIKKFPWLKSFPYEGTVLYASRHRDLIDELIEQVPAEAPESLDEARATAREKLEPLGALLASLRDRHPFSEPWQYLAVLSADGDEMGRVLSKIAKAPEGAARHREFTRAQSRFAKAAREIINGKGAAGRSFSGVCVYASADDILAFVAADHAIQCADELRRTFVREVGAVAEKFGVAAPTLSVGIAIGHFMEPLEDLLEFARTAEKRAKIPAPTDGSQRPRNALAISIHTRGGAPLIVRDHWDPATGDSEVPFAQRILAWADLHRHKHLPVKAAYDLRFLAREYPEGDNDEIRLEALRILGRKRAGSGGVDTVTRVRALISDVRSAGDLRLIADELVIGQWIGDAMDQASGQRQPKEASGGLSAGEETT